MRPVQAEAEKAEGDLTQAKANKRSGVRRVVNTPQRPGAPFNAGWGQISEASREDAERIVVHRHLVNRIHECRCPLVGLGPLRDFAVLRIGGDHGFLET